jgi:hypothetical protein
MARAVATERRMTIVQTIESFLLSCRVEGKSYGTARLDTKDSAGRWESPEMVH